MQAMNCLNALGKALNVTLSFVRKSCTRPLVYSIICHFKQIHPPGPKGVLKHILQLFFFSIVTWQMTLSIMTQCIYQCRRTGSSLLPFPEKEHSHTSPALQFMPFLFKAAQINLLLNLCSSVYQLQVLHSTVSEHFLKLLQMAKKCSDIIEAIYGIPM